MWSTPWHIGTDSESIRRMVTGSRKSNRCKRSATTIANCRPA